jgi:hypothetical protein
VTDQKNRGLLIAVLVVALIVAAASWPLGMMGPYGMRPWIMGRGRFGLPLFWISGLMRLVFWGVFVVAVLLLVRPRAGRVRAFPPRIGAGHPQAALRCWRADPRAVRANAKGP